MLVKLKCNIVEWPYIGHVQVSDWHSQISRDCFPPQPHNLLMSDGAGSVAHFRVLLLAVSFSGNLRQQCFHMLHFVDNTMAYNSMKQHKKVLFLFLATKKYS